MKVCVRVVCQRQINSTLLFVLVPVVLIIVIVMVTAAVGLPQEHRQNERLDVCMCPCVNKLTLQRLIPPKVGTCLETQVELVLSYSNTRSVEGR